MGDQIQRMVVLSKEELKFLQNEKGNMKEYTPNYIRVLKHRILRNHRLLAHEALLIEYVQDSEINCPNNAIS